MSREVLRIATRSSPLAIWQAEYVQQRLESLHEGLSVELVRIKTQGDKILDTPLAKIGGKGLFVKELEEAIMDGRADIAVHSMKDVPMELPEGFALPVICEREDPRDAFVSNHHDSLSALPQGACVGTSSLRRQAQVQANRPDPGWASWMPGSLMPLSWRLPASSVWRCTSGSATKCRRKNPCRRWARAQWVSNAAMVMPAPSNCSAPSVTGIPGIGWWRSAP